MLAGHPPQRLFLGQLNGLLVYHVDRHPQGGPPGPLAHPRLEHPQLALVDGELGVAHVTVVGLEPGEDGQELAVDLGELDLELGQGLGIPDAGHHVLALGVDQEVAVLPHLAGGRVTGEADSGSRVVVTVAEHHGLHVDRRSQLVGDPLPDPVGNGTWAVPRGEDRLDGATQLLAGVLGERAAGVALHDLLIGVDQVAQELDGDAGVGGGPRQLLGRVEQGVELLAGDPEDDAAVHGDEAPVGVVGEALVMGLLGQGHHRLVVEAQVEHGVHHPGHRELGTRAHRHQQRIARIADALTDLLLEPDPRLGDLLGQTDRPAILHVGPTGGGSDGEPGGHRQLEDRRHLGQVGTLAAQEVLHLHGWLAVRVVEVEDKRHRVGSPDRVWSGSSIGTQAGCRPVSLPGSGLAQERCRRNPGFVPGVRHARHHRPSDRPQKLAGSIVLAAPKRKNSATTPTGTVTTQAITADRPPSRRRAARDPQAPSSLRRSSAASPSTGTRT